MADAIERAKSCLAEIAGNAVLDTNADGYYHVSVCLSAMLAFVQQAPEGWEPIETAPKDETSVDLWVESDICEHGYRVTDAWWCPDAQAWLTSDADYGMPGDCLGPDDRATYWMPRPAPPAMLDASPSVGEGV